MDFLSIAGWLSAKRTFLAGDASNRRYERLSIPHEGTALLMDAPDQEESNQAFLDMTAWLKRQGFKVPDILAADAALGFVLLEDLGDLTYTHCLNTKLVSEKDLYTAAVDVLVDLYKKQSPDEGLLPPYDWAALEGELTIFLDWYVPAIWKRKMDSKERAIFLALWHTTYTALPKLPRQVCVLRDFHVDNLMWDPQGKTAQDQCMLLDYQDARWGSPAYDLVSLLEDARRDVGPVLAAAMRARYLSSCPDMPPAAFMDHYHWFGAQRSVKILGIFTRLCHRDGKKNYLQHVPRLWRWVEQNLDQPALQPLREWFDAHMPAAQRGTPGTTGVIYD